LQNIKFALPKIINYSNVDDPTLKQKVKHLST